jgi:hypothetical protein
LNQGLLALGLQRRASAEWPEPAKAKLKFVRLRWTSSSGIELARRLTLHFAGFGYFSLGGTIVMR